MAAQNPNLLTVAWDSLEGLFYDFIIPLGLLKLLEGNVQPTQPTDQIPQVLTPSPAQREWLSLPRT